MDYLIRESISAIAILERFSIIVFPLLNKTGVEKDFHRFNASGIDLNRSWNKDNVEEILFVKNIINMYTSIHTVIDIHGDEISTFNYVYHKNNLNNTFLQALQKGCPQIVPLPRQSTLKRFIKQLIRNGKVLNIFKTSLADYAAKKYHAHSYTIEISARATDIEDCKKIGENIAEALLESLLFI